MVIPMLKAVSKMLDVDGATATPSAFERVKCARIMLDGIIEGMGNTTTSISTSTVTRQEVPPPPPPKSEPEYKLEINEDKTLKLILRDGKELDGGTLLMVDGKKTLYSLAKNKPFGKLNVVDDA